MFVHETVVRLQHTDAAGVIFFARLFDLAHLAYEAFLDEMGHSLASDLADQPLVTPIAHATADYRAPLRLNDRLRVEVGVAEVGGRSFVLSYRFLKRDGTVAAEARTAHVAVDSETGKSTQLPRDLARSLLAHRLRAE